MYLPAYRAGTNKVAGLRRRYTAGQLLPVLYGCSGLVDVTTIEGVLAIDIGRLSPAFPVTPPDMRVRIRRFGGLSYRPPANFGIPSESK
jgi:hypothetical protein